MGMEVEHLSPGMEHGGDSEIAVELRPNFSRLCAAQSKSSE
jgi:hypothetical protein